MAEVLTTVSFDESDDEFKHLVPSSSVYFEEFRDDGIIRKLTSAILLETFKAYTNWSIKLYGLLEDSEGNSCRACRRYLCYVSLR